MTTWPQKFYTRFTPRDAPTPVDISDIKIKYTTIIIHRNNIQSLRKRLVHGLAFPDRGYIQINRYIISNKLNLSRTDTIYDLLRTTNEARTIQHELKHCRNWGYHNILFDNTNPYEHALYHAFDEISAYTVGNIQDALPAGRDCMHNAVIDATREYMQRPSYLDKHLQIIPGIIEDIRTHHNPKDFIYEISKLATNNPIKYRPNFYAALDYFFTFGEYRLFDPRHPIPPELSDMFSDIRMTYEMRIREILLRSKENGQYDV